MQLSIDSLKPRCFIYKNNANFFLKVRKTTKIVNFPLFIPDSISFVSKHVYNVITSKSRLPIEN